MTQEQLIDKAVKETLNLLHMPCGLDVLATEAIKTYIKLKDMENTNISLMDRILDLSCSDLTKLLRGLNMILKDSHISQRELFNRFGSCSFATNDKSVNMLVDKNDKFIYVINEGNEHTIYGYKSKADILKAVGLTNEVVNTRKNEIVELIEKAKNSKDSCGINESDIEKVVQEEYTESKHDCGDIPITFDEVDKWAKSQYVDIKDRELRDAEDTDKSADDGTDEGLLSSQGTQSTTHYQNNKHSSKGHLLKVTKKYPHRVNQLQLLHNKHKIQQMSKIGLTQGVSILECYIIWNDDVWSDEHIVPYNVAVYEGELAKDVDSEVGFQFYSFKDMYDYLEWKPNQDFTIVRIRDYYTTINK